MRLKTLSIVCIFVVFYSVSLHAAFNDRIIAIVNDEVITLSELNTTLQAYMERIESIPQGVKQEEIVAQARVAAMNNLIDTMLIKQEAARLKIVVTDENVTKTIDGMLDEQNMSIEKLKEALSEEKTTFDEYREEIRKNLITRRLIQTQIRSRITIDEKEIGEYYSKHRDKYEGKEATRIQQIFLVKPKGCNKSTRLKLRFKARKILKELKNGKSFGLLVEEYSQGPAVNSRGDLGFVEQGMMFPEVDFAISKLKRGESSGVIESPVGFHIMRVIDKRGAGIKPVEEVRAEIVEIIGGEKVKNKFEGWLKELREKSLVEIKL
ncbi:MAG: SurA N-terminal domain-containing protein [Thermodesulfobacteriota bacterium]|nr:SurA N-terminal domain-containing protein [Thermodesulfobacteriota bacterium]